MAQIHPNITRIPALWGREDLVNLYLVEGERRALVDTGAFDSPARSIVPALAERGLTLADIDVILITHGHADHTGGNHTVQQASKAKLLMSKDEHPVLVRGGTRAKANLFRPLHDVFDRQAFKSRLEANVRNSGERYRVDRTVSDGDVVDLGRGVELRVVALPGHSPGCVGYFWEKEGILLAGDAMQGLGWQPGVLPIIWDPDAYGKSGARLLSLPLQQLCLAHDYCSLDLAARSVRAGAEIRTYLEECIYVNNELVSAARRAVKAEPDASLWRLGERLLEELPALFAPKPLAEQVFSVVSAMGLFSRIWEAREAESLAEIHAPVSEGGFQASAK